MMPPKYAIFFNFVAFCISSTSGMGSATSASLFVHVCTLPLVLKACPVYFGSSLKAIVSFAPAELSHDRLGLDTIGVLYTCFAVYFSVRTSSTQTASDACTIRFVHRSDQTNTQNIHLQLTALLIARPIMSALTPKWTIVLGGSVPAVVIATKSFQSRGIRLCTRLSAMGLIAALCGLYTAALNIELLTFVMGGAESASDGQYRIV